MKKKMKESKLCSSLVLLMILAFTTLTGCAESKTEVPDKAEGSITIGVTSFADTLEPTEQYFSWVVSRYAIGETLVSFDKEGELVPSLAESWTISPDHKTWTFKIREGVKFSNGDDMTPELVKASLERTFQMADRAETFFVPVSMTVEGQDLAITTEEPVAILPGSLADPLFLIVNTKVDTSAFAMDGPVCTGPYMVESFSPTDTCVVVKNPHYWGGEVPFEKVNFKCINDQSTRSLALQSGEIDIAYNLKTENVVEFENMDSVEIQRLQSLRSTYAFMNQNGALKDLALRQALIRGLDRGKYCDTLLQGGATAGKAPIPPTLDFGFDELKDENAYDPQGAKELLKNAGYVDVDGDGYVETPSGDKLDLQFVIYTSREELGVYAQAAQANLKDIGIRMTLKTVSYETLLDMRDSGTYDLLIWNVLVANTGDPEKYLRENWYSEAQTNTAGYKNDTVDKLLDQMSAEFDEKTRRDLAIQIQQLIMDDAATVFFGYETTYLFSSKALQGVALYPIDYYWLTTEIDSVK